jgi:pimeloyl-ACP methyl ester carboxylesterase
MTTTVERLKSAKRSDRRRARLMSAGAVGAVAAATLILAPTARATAPASAPTIAWTPCEGSTVAQCGTLKVPVDWANPHGAQIAVGVARRPAGDPAHKIGTLFYNPGGPGDPADNDVSVDAVAALTFSPELLARFDVVGMEPRGILTTAIRCGVPALTPEDTLYPDTPQEFARMRAHSRELGLSCLEQTGALMRHADTVSVTRDHEALRLALGVDTISWLGLSYGAQLAGNYGELFPKHVRAMVIDGALDHSTPEGVQALEETRAAEDGFNRFARWCDTSTTCALNGRDVAATFDRLVAGANRNPIPVEWSMRPVNGEDIRRGTAEKVTIKDPVALFGPDFNWAGLSRDLKNALNGDASAFAMPPLDLVQSGLFSQAANACLDYDVQVHTFADMRQRIRQARRIAPHLQGASATWQVLRCIDWPIAAVNPAKRLDVRGVPTLIVNALHDPQTPHGWAVRLQSQIRGSLLLTRTGDGHTSYHTSACAQAAIDAYLVTRRTPASLVCQD